MLNLLGCSAEKQACQALKCQKPPNRFSADGFAACDSTQAKEAQHQAHDNDKTYDVNDGVHNNSTG